LPNDRLPLWTAGVRKEVLPNGLTVLVQEERSAPVVAIVTYVKAGFFDEPDRWTGISHVLEHMFFKGTARRGVGAIARETKSAGGYLNASTSYDHTAYFTVLPASGLATALDIQADALRNALIDPTELARELQVIIEEAKRKLDTPSAVVHETLHEVMFDRHRIRRWRIGREDQLAGFTRDDLWAYYRSRYVPERIIVAIVGAVERENALSLARAAYGDWPASPGALDRSPEEPPHREVRARTLRGDVSQADLAIGWRTVPPLHYDAPALDLGSSILSSGRGSWLYRSLRERGVVTWISAHNYAPTELGVFSVNAELPVGRLSQAVDGIAEEIARLSFRGPSTEELGRALTLLQARWARRFETMEGRAGALAAAEALDDVTFLDREYQLLAAVTPDQVREVAGRYLDPENVSAVAYLPEDQGPELTPDRLSRAFAVTALQADEVLPAAVPSLKPRRSAQGNSEAEVLHTSLPGVDLLVRRKPGVPLVHLGIHAPKLAFDPPAQAGLGALTVRSAVRGAGGLDAGALAYAFERLGGTLASSTASDWLGWGTSVMAEHLGEAAALLELVFRDPLLAASEVESERGLMIAEAEQVADDMFRYPFQLAMSVAFGDQGYGLPVGGLPHTLPAITAADIRAWHERAILSVRPVVIAVGDVNPGRASEILAGAFGDWPERLAVSGLAPFAWVPNGREAPARIVTRAKAQAALAMVFPGPDRRDPDRAAAQVWSAVASGLGGRLFEALRDRRSLAYTVMATVWQKARAGALLGYIATSPQREEEARASMLQELERFAAEAVSESELRQAISYLTGQADVNRQSGASLSGEILEAWIAGTGLRELEDPGALFRKVTAQDIQRVATRYLKEAHRAEGVIRGTGIILPPAGAPKASAGRT
jgi:zinc protease